MSGLSENGVVFFSHESRLFGAPRSLLALIQSEVDRRPVRLVVAEEGPLADEAQALGVPVDRLPRAFAGGVSVGARAIYGSKLLAYLRRHRPGLVYVNTVAHASPVIAASMLDLRCLLHVRETEAYFSPRTAKGRWRMRRMLAYPQATVCVSEATRELVLSRGSDPGRTTVVYNGVDVDSFTADPERRRQYRRSLDFAEDDVVFGFVGQWSRRKGVDLILDAATRLQHQPLPIRFLFVGGGNDPEFDREFRARAAAISPAPVLVDFTSDVRPALDASDVFLCPSRAEPFARVNLEAMAMGLPVIASRVGGNPEAVEDRRTGRLIPSDDANALAKSILELASDDSVRESLGLAGRDRVVKRFSMEAYRTRVGALIDALLEQDS